MKKQFLFLLIYFCLGRRWAIWTPTLHPSPPPITTYLVLKTMERGVPCNYWVREKETKREIFALICRGGRLWSFRGS